MASGQQQDIIVVAQTWHQVGLAAVVIQDRPAFFVAQSDTEVNALTSSVTGRVMPPSPSGQAISLPQAPALP
jgi:hypothetical protein